MVNSYIQGLDSLCVSYARLLVQLKDRASHAKVGEAYKTIFSANGFNSVDPSIEVKNSWLEAYSTQLNLEEWVSTESLKTGVEASELKAMSDVWLERLKATVVTSRLHSVVVWRYVRTPESTLKYVAWDATDGLDFCFPKAVIHVPGGDVPDARGSRFMWLATVMPECLIECVDFPLGGSGKSQPLHFTYLDVINNADIYNAYWLKSDSISHWDNLEMLLKLKVKIPLMTGYPVLNIAIEKLLEGWTEIVDKK